MKAFKFFLVILLFALFASIFSLQKISLTYSEPFFLIGFRMTIAGALLMFLSFSFNIGIKKIKISDIKFFIYLSFFNIYLNSILEIWGLNNISSSKACIIYSLSPFITSVVAFFILNEKITIRKFLGIVIGFIGLIPIIFAKTPDEFFIPNVLFFSLSELSLILAVFCSVFGWIFLKKIITLGYSFFFANAISMFFGGILILCNSFIFNESWNLFPVINWNKFLIYTFISILISNIICFNLFGYLLKFFSTTFMTFSGLMTPFFASFFGWLLLDEIVSKWFFLSMIIFFIGLLIFYIEENK